MNNQIPLIVNDGYILIAAIFFYILVWYCTGQLYLNNKRFAFIIPLIIISFSLGANILSQPSENIEYTDELEPLLSRINPAYERIGGLKEDLILYLENKSDDDEDQLIDELNRKISLMEEDLKRFETLKKLNRQNEKEIANLKDKIGAINLNTTPFENVKQVATYEQAVRPSSPIVRDFAVKLA